MKCCVFGGAGFIGSHLVPLLIASGREVTIIDKAEVYSFHNFLNVKYFQYKKSKEFLRSILSDADEVIDLAYTSTPQKSFQDPINDVNENISRSIELFDSASDAKLKKYIYISSGGTVYGNPEFLPITENHKTDPVSSYGVTKLLIEKLGLMYFKTRGLPFVIIRPSNPYGENQIPFSGQGIIPTVISSLIKGREINLFGGREIIRDYLYIGDLVEAITQVLNYGLIGEVYNVGSGKGTSNTALLELILKTNGEYSKNIDIKHFPQRIFDVSSNILCINKITELTKWQPKIPLNEGLKITFDFFLGKRSL